MCVCVCVSVCVFVMFACGGLALLGGTVKREETRSLLGSPPNTPLTMRLAVETPLGDLEAEAPVVVVAATSATMAVRIAELGSCIMRGAER